MSKLANDLMCHPVVNLKQKLTVTVLSDGHVAGDRRAGEAEAGADQPAGHAPPRPRQEERDRQAGRLQQGNRQDHEVS